MNNLKSLKHLFLATLLDVHFESNSEVEVTFVKVIDGSTRVMKCTTSSELIEASAKDAKTKKELEKGPTPVANLTCKRVFDLEKNEFRAFNYDTIITVDGMTIDELYQKYVD